MSLFASNRERRLWTWALVCILTIYASVGLAQSAAGLLIEHGLLVAAFLLGMVLVATTIVTQGLQKKPAAFEVGLTIGIVTVFFMLAFRLVSPTERSHVIEYGVVAVFIYEALVEHKNQGRRVPVPWLLAILLTSLVGTIDEGIQWLMPNRVFSYEDIIFNSLAALGAVSTCALLGWIRKWREKRNP